MQKNYFSIWLTVYWKLNYRDKILREFCLPSVRCLIKHVKIKYELESFTGFTTTFRSAIWDICGLWCLLFHPSQTLQEHKIKSHVNWTYVACHPKTDTIKAAGMTSGELEIDFVVTVSELS